MQLYHTIAGGIKSCFSSNVEKERGKLSPDAQDFMGEIWKGEGVTEEKAEGPYTGLFSQGLVVGVQRGADGGGGGWRWEGGKTLTAEVRDDLREPPPEVVTLHRPGIRKVGAGSRAQDYGGRCI